MAEITKLVHKYLRHDKKFPHVWCPGCGNGIVLGAMIRAIDRLAYRKDDIVMVSGIGCSGRLPVYVDFNTLHTTHGRALTFATGVKLAKPELKVIVVMGDGDATAIGGNHFIHAARRNINLTAIIINNNIYGMTGGQYSVGRGTVYHARLLDKLIEKAFVKRGFGVVEVITHCHTQYGRRNRMGDAVAMMKWQKEHAVRVEKSADMSAEELRDKFTIGVLVDRDLPVYTEQYELVRKQARDSIPR
jgi:2-oxoglutarate ferredoxin oxidoreductase subunit beta